MFTYAIDTEHHLRLLEEEDAREVYAVVAANRDYLSRWMPWAGAQTQAGTLEFIRQSRRQLGENQAFQAAIVSGGSIVGVMGFNGLDWDHRSTEIGYWIAEPAQGRGIVTRGVRALTEHAFSVWAMNRVVLQAGVDNTPSRRVAERLGFTFEGVARQAERVGDHWVDLSVYAMLAEEWPGTDGRL